MLVSDEWRPFLRRIVNEGGDIGDVARAIRDHGEGRCIQAGHAAKHEFGLRLPDVSKIIAWAEAKGGDDGLAELRSEIRTPLR